MLNILQTKIAFADLVKENVLNKIVTRIVYSGDKETCLKLEVADTLVLKDTLWILNMTYIMRNNLQVLCWYFQKEEYKYSLYEHSMWC